VGFVADEGHRLCSATPFTREAPAIACGRISVR
jgi:hypothetical protein